MKTTIITCHWCKKQVDRPTNEVNRQLRNGATRFFCSGSCARKYGNSLRDDLRINVTKICPHCKNSFDTMTGCKEPTYCSRKCASAASVTPTRREAARRNNNLSHSLEQSANGLRTREMWKYENLQHYLTQNGIVHQFEYCVGTGIYDLAIFEKHLLIEFDGPYHQQRLQRQKDAAKDTQAIELGWCVVRIPVEQEYVFPPAILQFVVDSL